MWARAHVLEHIWKFTRQFMGARPLLSRWGVELRSLGLVASVCIAEPFPSSLAGIANNVCCYHMWPLGGRRRDSCVSAPQNAGEASMGVYLRQSLEKGRVEADSTVHNPGVTITTPCAPTNPMDKMKPENVWPPKATGVGGKLLSAQHPASPGMTGENGMAGLKSLTGNLLHKTLTLRGST